MVTQSSPNDYPPGYLEESIGPTLVAISALFIALDVVFVCLRFYSRRLIKTPLGWDDILILPALILNLATCSLTLLSVHIAGVGQHLPAVLAANPATLLTWGKIIYALLIIYSLAVAFPKLSILALYLRIFTEKPYRISTWVVAAIISGTAIAVSLVGFFQCSPVPLAWDKSIEGGTCIDVALFYVYCSVPNVLTDVAMLLLPIPMILKLHTNQSQKIGLSFIFLLGTIGLISSCVRLVMFSRNNAFNDQTWRSVTLMTWTDVEASIYLIAACLPSLRPLARSLAHQRIFGKHYWSNQKNLTSEERARSESSARANLSGRDGFRRLGGEHGNISEAERGEHSVQASLSGDITRDEGLELAQLTTEGQIRVTNDVQVEYESKDAQAR